MMLPLFNQPIENFKAKDWLEVVDATPVFNGEVLPFLAKSTRKTYLLDEKVLKVDNYQEEKLFDTQDEEEYEQLKVHIQSQREFENFQSVEEEDLDYFAKVEKLGYSNGYAYVIQEKVETNFSNISGEALNQLVEDFNYITMKYNISDARLWINDGKVSYAHNIGHSEGKIKFFDLGFEDW